MSSHSFSEALHEAYVDRGQQKVTATLGMWTFIATEVLLFGGLFLAYTIIRAHYEHVFAETAKTMDIPLGTLNTAILLISSGTIAAAEHCADAGRRKPFFWLGGVSVFLGVCFLFIKGYEYFEKFKEHHVPGKSFDMHAFSQPGPAQLFFFLYFVLTGLHFMHLTIGCGWWSWLTWRGRATAPHRDDPIIVGNAALYWHLVDIIWIFLYPLFYLIH